MKEIIRESLKLGALYALIGVAVALAAPPLLTLMLGATAAGTAGVISAASVLHVGLLFSGFGILEPPVKSLFSFIFSKGSPEQTKQATACTTPSDAKQLNINIQQAPEQAQQADAKFRKKVDAERATCKAADNSPAVGV